MHEVAYICNSHTGGHRPTIDERIDVKTHCSMLKGCLPQTTERHPHLQLNIGVPNLS